MLSASRGGFPLTQRLIGSVGSVLDSNAGVNADLRKSATISERDVTAKGIAGLVERSRIVIEPSRGWRAFDMKGFWEYRELLWVLILRDIKVRYSQTVLGAAWVVLQAVATTGLFTLVFGTLVKIPSDGYPYAAHLFSALLPWMFFANAVSASGNSVVNSSGLIGKIYFPRIIIPFASVGAGLVDFCISVVLLLLLLLVLGTGWTVSLVVAPFLLIPVAMTSLGVGIFLSALIVSYRDFRHVIPFLLQVWMFATPVVYPATLVPERWQWILHLNPLSGLIGGFRSAFLGRPFDLRAIGVSCAWAIFLFLLGVAYFEKVERRFADII
jgi:lipopolysaccharide transport system permease protein